MKKNMITRNEAMETIYTYVAKQEIFGTVLRCNNDIFEIGAKTLFQNYTFFVSAIDGTILGMDSEPAMNTDGLYINRQMPLAA